MTFPCKKHSSDFWKLVKQCSLLCQILTQDHDKVAGSLGELDCVNGFVKEGFVVMEFHDFAAVAFREEPAPPGLPCAPFNAEAVVQFRLDCRRVVGNLKMKSPKPVYFTGHGSAGLTAIHAADRDWVAGVVTFGLTEKVLRDLEIPSSFPSGSIFSIELEGEPGGEAGASRIVLPKESGGNATGMARFTRPINKAILTKWTPRALQQPLPPLDDLLAELEGKSPRPSAPAPAAEALKSPLKVLVFCHRDDEESTREYVENLRLLFDGFTEETDGYLSGFSGLPGVLRVVSSPPTAREADEIRRYLDDTLHSLIVVLMDNGLAEDRDCMGWLEAAAHILSPQGEPPRHQILPVGVQDLAFARTEAYPVFSNIQHVPARDLGHAAVSGSHAALLVVAQAYQLVGNALGGHKRLTLFLSHAKKDGLPLAKSINAQIQQLPGDFEQHRFFDTESLEPGKPWDEQLRNRAGCSVMLVLRTRLYETRAWCREEFLTAVKKDVPIIIVEARSGEDSRESALGGVTRETSLPFGRYPVTHVRDGNLLRVIGLALTEGLRQLLFERDAFQAAQSGLTEPEVTRLFNLSSGIEGLLEICRELEKTNTPWQPCRILYREPPISATLEEGYERILRSFFNFGKLTTCTRLQEESLKVSIDRKLTDKVAGISISEVDGFLPRKDANQLTLEATRRLFAHGAAAAFGHDWREGGIMEAIYDNMRRSLPPGAKEEDFRILNVVPWHNGTRETRSEESAKRLQHVKFLSAGLPEPLSEQLLGAHPELAKAFDAVALSEMRQQLAKLCHFRICIGGRLGRFSGVMPGLLEEAALAVKLRQPLYLCGHWGGATRAVGHLIFGSGSPNLEPFQPGPETLASLRQLRETVRLPPWGVEEAVQTIAGLSVEQFGQHNGLTPEENRRLFELSDLRQIMTLVIQGLDRAFGDC